MMSLGVSKGGVIPPSEEDRKKIIRQMKVRTTLKGDKSWIYPQNSDNEEEMKRSSLNLPCRSGKIDGGSPASASVTPHGNRLPGSKPTSGYLIRGVFTRTIEKTSPESTFYSNGTQKSAAAQAKSASLPRFSSGYKMTTEDYKKLAPFNVRQISVDSDEEKTAFSPDEHKKRTEAANSVLRRTASRERSYVLSAAKKSNGSPTQEVPPFIAKSVEIEEEGGLHMQNQTLPASSRFGLGGKSINGERKRPTGSSWSKPKPMTAVSTTSFDTDSKSQATRSWSESTSQISSYTEISDKVDEEKPVETSPAEATTTKPTLATGRSDKPVKEEPDLISWDESVPKATTISTGERSSPRSRDIPAHPTDARFTAPGYLGDAECDPKRSVPGYEEGRPTREVRYESTRATEHKEPELNVTRSSPSSGDSSAVIQEVRHRVPMHLDDEEFDFNSRSSSHSTESNVTTTDPRHGIPVCMEDGELDPERLFPLKGNTEDAENENISATQSEPPTTRKHTEPDENMAQLPSASSERISMSTASFQYHSPSAMGHKSNPSTASKGILFVKEYVNSRELSPTPHYSSDSLIDLSDIERASYLHSSASQRSCEGVCTYCGREIRDCPKIMIEHLNVYCHEYCFRCGICHKAMGDLLDKIFIHRDIVHCDQCYEKLF
ncbi:zinc finger protein 185 isoform X1 [Chelonia mydas]|uniref:zinc finger protein 185 isoform X1 n=2 Tax=Chelonia mydas TaxID=8469 RepID=UPI001CA8488B|nr:zinc finger protein 185 isoform X1 [Chelonia mydas]